MNREFIFIVSIKEDSVNIEHNCSSLIEFIGIIELMKSIALNRTVLNRQQQHECKIQRKDVESMEPDEYLKWLEGNTRILECKGIKKTFLFKNQ